MIESAREDSSYQFKALAAREKLQYMLAYARTSTIATILAPLLCIPLYIDSTDDLLFKAWFALMAAVVIVRLFLIRAVAQTDDVQRNMVLLNTAVGIVTFVWGLGWFVFVTASEPMEYLTYQIISLTVLFVGMVGCCVNWKTFFAFVFPLRMPELIYVVTHHDVISLPIPLGSLVAFYLALKMGILFSKSWENHFRCGSETTPWWTSSLPKTTHRSRPILQSQNSLQRPAMTCDSPCRRSIFSLK